MGDDRLFNQRDLFFSRCHEIDLESVHSLFTAKRKRMEDEDEKLIVGCKFFFLDVKVRKKVLICYEVFEILTKLCYF